MRMGRTVAKPRAKVCEVSVSRDRFRLLVRFSACFRCFALVGAVVGGLVGSVVGGLIGHYFGESAGDVINDQGVNRVAEGLG